jgi:hypothetical protein
VPPPTLVKVGDNCSTDGSATCEGGINNCGVTNSTFQVFTCGYSLQNCYNGFCCTCVAPKTILDGGLCNNTQQCKGVSSVCLGNGTCANVVGMDCVTYNDCQYYYQGSSSYQFDCSCDRKCYLLNAPTPKPVTVAPSPGTRAPTPGSCDSQANAWGLVKPSGFTWYSNIPGYVLYDGFDSLTTVTGQLVRQAILLTPADQATLIAFVCCRTCPSNNKFNSHLYQGYQVDCTARTLTKLADTCDDLRNALAFVNCWTGVQSPASTATVGIGALLVTFVVLLF